MVVYMVNKATTTMITYSQVEISSYQIPRTNNINNHPLLTLHDSEDYEACCFVEEDDNFPGYAKLSLAEVKTNSVYLNHSTRINDGKLYLSNSKTMDSLCNTLVKPMTDYIIPIELEQSLDTCQLIYVNGPAHTLYNKDNRGHTQRMDTVHCIHYDVWPK